jgi:hypothetical protein
MHVVVNKSYFLVIIIFHVLLICIDVEDFLYWKDS